MEYDDLEKLDINNIPAELKPFYNSMLSDYRRKTEAVANRSKDLEAKYAGYENLQAEFDKSTNDLKSWEDFYNYMVENPDEWNKHVSSKKGDNKQASLDQGSTQSTVTREEMKRLEAIDKKLSDLEQSFSKEREYSKNLRALEYQALDLRLKPENLKNPEFSIQKVIETAVKSNISDLSIAAKVAYAEEEKTKAISQAVEQAKKDWEIEQQNKQAKVIGSSGFLQSRIETLDKPISKPELKAKIFEEVYKKYGSIPEPE